MSANKNPSQTKGRRTSASSLFGYMALGAILGCATTSSTDPYHDGGIGCFSPKEHRKKMEEREQQAAGLEARTRQITSEVATLKTANAAFEAELAKTRAELEGLTQPAREKMRQLEQLEAERRRILSETSQIEKDAQSRQSEKQERLAKLKQELAELQAINATLLLP